MPLFRILFSTCQSHKQGYFKALVVTTVINVKIKFYEKVEGVFKTAGDQREEL